VAKPIVYLRSSSLLAHLAVSLRRWPLAGAVAGVQPGVMETTTTPRPTVFTAEAIRGLPAVSVATPTGPAEGVMNQVLWRTDTSMAGVLSVRAGHRLGTHRHRVNHHHMWVVDGEVEILGELLGRGSYVHIPSGVAHDLDATNTGGCTVFYVYILPGS